MFNNRTVAAELLLEKLKKFKDKNVIVAGIPRGAIPMAKIIADGLNAELTAVLVHKITAPDNQEFAMGCVGLSGHIHFLSHAGRYGISKSFLQDSANEELKVLKSRKDRYGISEQNFKGKTVIIVDDGIATGATTMCAVHEIRSQSPKEIILATPVSSSEAAQELTSLVDEFISLYIPPVMFSIGEFYQHFAQVSDAEVISILHRPEKISENHP